MSTFSIQANAVDIRWSDTLEQSIRYIVERARAYDTVILLYEDEMSGRVMAVWAEKDRLQLTTRKVGETKNGIEVHTFGLEAFPPDTVVELSLRSTRQDSGSGYSPPRALYRSILNELSLISVKVHSKFSFPG